MRPINSKKVRNTIAERLPSRNLKILVPVLERFVVCIFHEILTQVIHCICTMLYEEKKASFVSVCRIKILVGHEDVNLSLYIQSSSLFSR